MQRNKLRFSALLTALVPALLATLLLVACQATPPALSPPVVAPAGKASAVSYSGGDGSSMEQAVIVMASSERFGVPAEYQWLRTHHPGCKRTMQALIRRGDKSYDALDIELANGDKLKVWFDISSFFAKY